MRLYLICPSVFFGLFFWVFVLREHECASLTNRVPRCVVCSANYILIEEGFGCKEGGAFIQGEKKIRLRRYLHTEHGLVDLSFFNDILVFTILTVIK